jgi:hypothetical protein
MKKAALWLLWSENHVFSELVWRPFLGLREKLQLWFSKHPPNSSPILFPKYPQKFPPIFLSLVTPQTFLPKNITKVKTKSNYIFIFFPLRLLPFPWIAP